MHADGIFVTLPRIRGVHSSFRVLDSQITDLILGEHQCFRVFGDLLSQYYAPTPGSYNTRARREIPQAMIDCLFVCQQRDIRLTRSGLQPDPSKGILHVFSCYNCTMDWGGQNA